MSDQARKPSMPSGGKRLALDHSSGLGGDWFVGWSPRNGYNASVEGPWDHWVALALGILQHPATALVRPEAHSAVQGVPNPSFYSETGRDLTDDEVERLFDEGGHRW